VCDVVCGVRSHVGNWVDGEVGDEVIWPYRVPIHRLGPVEAAGKDADCQSVDGSVVVAKCIVVVSRE
jgi:hypothetical protein